MVQHAARAPDDSRVPRIVGANSIHAKLIVQLFRQERTDICAQRNRTTTYQDPKQDSETRTIPDQVRDSEQTEPPPEATRSETERMSTCYRPAITNGWF